MPDQIDDHGFVTTDRMRTQTTDSQEEKQVTPEEPVATEKPVEKKTKSTAARANDKKIEGTSKTTVAESPGEK